jgi:hypothetical protein
LSKRQKDAALRVASVPEPEFMEAVESDSPPTVTKLAERAKKSIVDLGTSTPRNFSLATKALGTLANFAEFCRKSTAYGAPAHFPHISAVIWANFQAAVSCGMHAVGRRAIQGLAAAAA